MSNVRQPLYGQAADRVRDQLHAAALPAIPAQPTAERLAESLPSAGAFPGAEQAREHAEHGEVFAALARECQQRGITLGIGDDASIDLTLVTVDGVRALVGPYDRAEEALDDLTGLGRCIDCRSTLDDTAAPYADGYTHIDGSPIMICRSCRDKRLKLASDPGRLAFSRAMDAIEAVFQASKNPEMTRQALREFVNMTADAIHAGGTR